VTPYAMPSVPSTSWAIEPSSAIRMRRRTGLLLRSERRRTDAEICPRWRTLKCYAEGRQAEEFTRSRSTCRRRVSASPGAFEMACMDL
jgi:hypothetical protein